MIESCEIALGSRLARLFVVKAVDPAIEISHVIAQPLPPRSDALRRDRDRVGRTQAAIRRRLGPRQQALGWRRDGALHTNIPCCASYRSRALITGHSRLWRARTS